MNAKRSKNFLTNAALGAGMAIAFLSANSHTAHAAQKSNIDERIDRLQDAKSNSDNNELSALKAWKVNSESKNLTTLTSTKRVKKTKTAKAKPVVHSSASAAASSAASSSVSSAQQSQAQSSSASVYNANRQPARRQQSSNAAASTPARSSSAQSVAGLNMNQTSGTVNVTALANYMASRHPVMSAAAWRNVIFRESGGSLTATNPSSGAYGVFQLLGHGEYRGMTLGAQIAMACSLPASAWMLTNY